MPVRRPAAFTLVEIMIVVSVIALLVLIALPSFLRARQRSQNAKFVNDLRIVTAAFELYAAEHGDYPPNVTPGVLPAEMTNYFGPTFNFAAATPIGGNWDWFYRKSGKYVGVSVVAPAADDARMKEIDALVDDGDLSKGNFIQVDATRYLSLIE